MARTNPNNIGGFVPSQSGSPLSGLIEDTRSLDPNTGIQGLINTTQKDFGIAQNKKQGKSQSQGNAGTGGAGFTPTGGGGGGGFGGVLASNPQMIEANLRSDLAEFNQGFPLRQEKAQLQARGPSGLTIAGELRREAARARDESFQDVKNQAGRAGLIQSGFRNNASKDVTNRFLLAARQISQRVGASRIGQINQSLAQQKNQFAIQRALATGDIGEAERIRKAQLGGFGG